MDPVELQLEVLSRERAYAVAAQIVASRARQQNYLDAQGMVDMFNLIADGVSEKMLKDSLELQFRQKGSSVQDP